MAFPENNPAQTLEEKQEEQRKLRRLQLVLNMTLSVLRQDPHLTLAQANVMIANCKAAALAMFPDKEFTFDLLYAPRLRRAMDERFGPLQ
jgi:hypothetical protein